MIDTVINHNSRGKKNYDFISKFIARTTSTMPPIEIPVPVTVKSVAVFYFKKWTARYEYEYEYH